MSVLIKVKKITAPYCVLWVHEGGGGYICRWWYTETAGGGGAGGGWAARERARGQGEHTAKCIVGHNGS